MGLDYVFGLKLTKDDIEYNSGTMFLCMVLVLFSFYFVSYFYDTSKRKTFKLSLGFSVKSNYVAIDYIVLMFLFISFFASYRYGFERVGIDSQELPSALWVFFKFLSPTYFIGIYIAINYNSNRLFFLINVLFFIFLGLFKGYSGPILTVGFLFLFRLYTRDKLNKKHLSLIIVSALILGPVIRIVKNLTIVGLIKNDMSFSQSLEYMYSIYEVESFIELYIFYIFKFIGRFESVSTLYFILDNRDKLTELYSSGHFYPFYLYHWLPQTIEKLFFSSSLFDISNNNDLQTTLAYMINPLFKWRSQATLFSWFFIESYLIPIYAAYVVLLIFISSKLTILMSKNSKGLEQVTWYYIIVFVTHGWFDLFLIYIQALLVFYFVCLILKFLNNNEVL